MSTRTQYSESEDDLEQLLDLDQPISSNWIVSSRESPIYASQLDQCTVLNSFNSKVNQSTDSGLDFSFNSSFSSIFPLEPEECVDGEGAAIQAQRGEFSGISEINPTPHELFVEQTQSSKYESQNLFSENYAAAQSSDEQRYSATENCIAVPPEINLLDPIVRLYANIKERYSDHAFVHTIAAQMCSELLPIDCCNSLKLGLLLSVVSTISARDTPPISIMALGRDTSMVASIMGTMGQYAQRFIVPTDEIKIGSVARDGEFLQANPLIMAQNGVCLIGDWLGLKSTCSNYIRNGELRNFFYDKNTIFNSNVISLVVMDSGRITVDAARNIDYPLKGAIWAYWSCSTRKLKETVNNVATFLSVFGIPIVLEDAHTEPIVDFLLQAATRNTIEVSNDDDIPEDVMKLFLNVVSRRNIHFSPEAEELLKSYFLATRSLRPAILSQRGFIILRQMAECHARLCLREFVLRNDVVVCIAIAEKYIYGIFGSKLSTAPSEESTTKTDQVDEYMRRFERWLDGYLESYAKNLVP